MNSTQPLRDNPVLPDSGDRNHPNLFRRELDIEERRMHLESEIENLQGCLKDLDDEQAEIDRIRAERKAVG